jgi:hypothetical protein
MSPSDWQREDILDVLSWCEDAADDINTITTELEYIVVGQLLKRCADEIKHLRRENAKLRNKKSK